MNPSCKFFLVAALGLAVLAGCSNEDIVRFPQEPPTGGGQPLTLDQFMAGAQAGGAGAGYVAEALPSGTTAAPVISGASQIVRGGALVLDIEVDDTATDLYMSLSNVDLGYYHFDLSALPRVLAADDYAGDSPLVQKLEASGMHVQAAAARAARVVRVTLTSRNDLSLSGFTVVVTTSDGSTASEAGVHVVTVNRIASSSGFLQASLNWNSPVDMDLHVQVPGGDEVFWANRNAGGGLLDLDSNAACSIDDVDNENIVWASQPEPGEYIVRVDLWSACEQPGPFPYVVTVVIDGEPQTFEGVFQALDADGGGQGAGVEIVRVTLP